MKTTFKLLFFSFLTTIVLMYVSCRKTDHTPEQAPALVKTNTVEEKFFNSHRTADPTEKALVEFIKKDNDKKHFVEKTVNQIGYPRWDKAIIANNVNGGVGHRGNNEDSINIVYVPFVRDSQNYVNAALIIKTQQTDTTFSYACDWQYQNVPSGLLDDTTASAEKIAFTLITLDKEVFGHNQYELLDETLFQNYLPDSLKGNKTYIKLGEETSNRNNNNNRTESMASSITFIVFCPSCVSSYWQVLYYYNLNGVPALEITSGGGGGESPPNNPCNSGGGVSKRDCGPGWEPIGGGGSPPSILPFFGIGSVTNNFTNPCIVAAKNKLPNFDLNIFANSLYFAPLSATNNWNIIFEENRNLVSGGQPSPAESFAVTPNKEWHVVLNPLFWEQATQPNAKQELAGLNILHEIVHGFIRVYKDSWGLTTLNTFNTHEVMFKNCVEAMSLILKQSFMLSDDDARALALQGLDDVLEKEYTAAGTLASYKVSYNQFAIDNYHMSIVDADAIYDQYISGTKGTKCF